MTKAKLPSSSFRMSLIAGIAKCLKSQIDVASLIRISSSWGEIFEACLIQTGVPKLTCSPLYVFPKPPSAICSRIL